MTQNAAPASGSWIAFACTIRKQLHERKRRCGVSHTVHGNAGARFVKALQMLAFSIDDTTTLKVVRRNFDHNTVTRHNPDEVLSHFASNVSHNLMAILQLDAELSVRDSLDHVTFNLDCFFLRHSEFFFRPFPKSDAGKCPEFMTNRGAALYKIPAKWKTISHNWLWIPRAV